MKFSIIIPCYNQAQYLPEAIESAECQDYPYEDFEVIIVNDGSPDATQEVAERYAGGNVKIIRQVNKGLASARNTALMNAVGEYILPLDADDVLRPDCLKKMAQISQQTDADVVTPSIHCFGLAEQDVILMPNPKFDDFKAGNRLCYCSAIKRSVLLECGGWSPKMDALGGYEDLHLWYDLMRRGKKIVTTQDILVNYRTKQTSMWTEAAKSGKHEKLWEQIIKDFPEAESHYVPH